MNIVYPDPNGPEWRTLIERSHQSSIFVQPEWLEAFSGSLHAPMAVEHRGEFRAAVVAQRRPERIHFYPYAGLLLTRREDPQAVALMLDVLENTAPGCAVVNAPSLVDVRPFTWQGERTGGIWTDTVRYTMFVDGKSRPFPDLPPPSPVPVPDLPGLDRIRALPGVQEEDGVVYAVDTQDRAYCIAAHPDAYGTVLKIAKRHASMDLMGCNSRSMNTKKRCFGARLRTIYSMALVS